MSKSSQARIKAFVDWFIRSEYMEGLTSDRDSDFTPGLEGAYDIYSQSQRRH